MNVNVKEELSLSYPAQSVIWVLSNEKELYYFKKAGE